MAADDQPNNQFQDLVNNSHQSSEESSDSFSDDNQKVPILLSANKLKEEEDLSIKNLKIPKSSEEEEEEEEEISFVHDHHHHHLPPSNEFPRICKVCNKGFSSGKALGGHSRIHAQQPKKQQSLLIKNNNFTHILPPPPPGTPTTTSTSAADSCNPNISSMNMNMNMVKKMYNSNTCSVCGKSFPSEKSLFGHMRCHPDRNWRGIQPPHHLPLTATANKNSSSSTLSEADDAEAVPRHKRDDHIDSATTTTTTTTTNRPSSSSSSSVVVDLSQSLSSSWLSTAKRGRKSTLSKSRAGSGCPSGLDEQIPDEDVVHNLMMLAQGHQDSLNSGLPLSYKQQQEQRDDQITNANSSITNVMPKIDSQGEQESKKKKMKRTIDSSLINYPAKKLKIEEGVLFISNVNNSSNGIPIPLKTMEKGKATQADSKDRDDLNTSGDELIQSSCRMIHLKKKKRRKLKLRDLDTFGGLDQIQNNNNPTVATPDRYKCTSCNKSFPTHQALGGHRSSHNKVKNIPALVKDEPAYAAAEGLLVDAECERTHATTQVGETEERDEEAASSRLQQGPGPYRCKVCNKTFATGQALGGHKRCHWTGPIEAPSSQVASSGEASHTGRRIPVFDLNEVPAMEDEEGVESAFAQPQHH